MRYVLASKSPRRKDLMKFISSDFLVATEDIDEESSYSLSPIDAVKDIALRKGKAVYKDYPNDLVISADTIVVIDNQIIGKPIDKDDAKRILRQLSGREHSVFTGFAIHYLNKSYVGVVESKVIFNNLSESLIDAYTENEKLRSSIKDFIEFRKQIKSPLTEKALTLSFNKLDKLAGANNDELKISIINQSIERGWKGLFEYKDNTPRSSAPASDYDVQDLSAFWNS